MLVLVSMARIVVEGYGVETYGDAIQPLLDAQRSLETNAWTLLANMPLTLYQGNGAGVINSQLYVAGGWNGPLPTSILLKYDIPGRLWPECRT